jgi:G3E family GTPase
LLVHTVVATIGTLCGAETLDRLPETTAQAACADRLLFTKTDLAMPSPMLRQRLEALNPAASMSLIAVGTPVAGRRPPHRSQRARFGHWAPTSGV